MVLTDNARIAIDSILTDSEAPEDSGLRIFRREGEPATFGVAVVAAPMDGDTVVEDRGVRVFLETAAVTVLDDKILDATTDSSRGVTFTVDVQR